MGEAPLYANCNGRAALGRSEPSSRHPTTVERGGDTIKGLSEKWLRPRPDWCLAFPVRAGFSRHPRLNSRLRHKRLNVLPAMQARVSLDILPEE